jgi:thiol-disulfide isomerase/thioredoxin
MVTFLRIRKGLVSAACALLAAASPAPAAPPSDPLVLLGLVGKTASDLTFAPLDGPQQPLAAPGKPTVVIVYASWCAPCLQEMPRNLADYEKYKDRVNFIGIDYSEPPSVAKNNVAKYGIPFPVESYDVGSGAVAAKSVAATPHTLVMPNSVTREQVLALQNVLPPDLFQKALTVFDARPRMSAAEFSAFEQKMGVQFEDPKQIAAETAKQPDTLTLPYTFVIDAHGVVVRAISGYDPDIDELAAELVKLGIK